MIKCAGCQLPIPNAAGCNILQDDDSMCVMHPACYEKYLAECEARAKAELQQAQQKERKRMAEWNALSQPREVL